MLCAPSKSRCRSCLRTAASADLRCIAIGSICPLLALRGLLPHWRPYDSPTLPQPADCEINPTAAAGREQLLRRIELLWNESLDGLGASKEPIRVLKPDGSTLELPGDLRTRSGFIREARQVLEFQATVNGNLAVGPTAQIMIVIPQGGASAPFSPELGEVDYIDISPPRR
jgi:hypothetical protein